MELKERLATNEAKAKAFQENLALLKQSEQQSITELLRLDGEQRLLKEMIAEQAKAEEKPNAAV